jgi:pimeloyl-ACP methyl ester carboxylesterase
MAPLADRGFLDLGPQKLEYCFAGPRPEAAPTLILLHEGLGCVDLWGNFPDKLAAASGMGVFAYSRAGYGASSSITLPRSVNYMHVEAQEVLPRVLDAIGFREGLLVGHSDGASIAAIYQGSIADPRVRGLTLIAPHFFVEDMTLVEIAKARDAYRTGLREKLARWHKDVDAAFLGWNGVWLDPEFRKWNIQKYLETIRVPVQVIQGVDDQYGTVAQVEAAKAGCPAPVDVVMLGGAHHAPHREAADATREAIAGFAWRVLDGDAGLRAASEKHDTRS